MENKQNWQPREQLGNQLPIYNQGFSQAQTTSQNFGGWPLSNAVTSTTTAPTQMSPQFYPTFDQHYSQWFQNQRQAQQQSSGQNNQVSPSAIPTSNQQGLSHNQQNVPPFFPYPFFNPLQHNPHQQIFPSMPSALPTNNQLPPLPQLSQLPQLPQIQQTPMENVQKTPEESVDRKRPRITYSPHQINYLEAWYNQKNQFISTQERNYLAQFLGVNANQVRIWFQNRRARDRRRRSNRSRSPRASLDSTPNGSFASADSPYTASPLTLSNDSGLGLDLSSTNSSFSTTALNATGLQQNGPSMLDMLRYRQSVAIEAQNNISNESPNKEDEEKSVPQSSTFEPKTNPQH